MTKKIFSDNRVEKSITAEKTSFKRNTVNVWPDSGYFKQQSCNFGIEKENLPENSIFYLNQGYQSVKYNKKTYYAAMFSIVQVNEYLNPPEDLHSYECRDRYTKLSAISWLEETHRNISQIMASAKKNSKILHSHYKKHIPNSF